MQVIQKMLGDKYGKEHLESVLGAYIRNTAEELNIKVAILK